MVVVNSLSSHFGKNQGYIKLVLFEEKKSVIFSENQIVVLIKKVGFYAEFSRI